MKSSFAIAIAVWCLGSCGGSPPEPSSDVVPPANDPVVNDPAVPANEEPPAQASRCTGELSFNHPRDRFEQGDACDVIDERWATVTDAERSCAADADCALITGSCFSTALTARAAREPRFAQTPCPSPNAGMCPPPDPGTAARCIRGCCVAVAP